MPVSFPSSPTSGQVYEFSFNSWMYTGVFWRSINASGSVTSGNLGDNLIFSGNIPSGSIGANHLASGVGGGAGLSLSSGTVTSGFIGDNAITSGNIASGQIGQYQINDYSLNYDYFLRRGGSKGYFAGGFTTVDVARVDLVSFATDITSSAGNILSQARSALGGSSGNGIKGYFAGGLSSGPTRLSTTDRVVYATTSFSNPSSANLSQAREANPCGNTDGSSKGYFAGGKTSSTVFVTTADKIIYSNDTTTAQTTARLTQARGWLAGCSEQSTKCYFAGGATTIADGVVTTDLLTYSTDTTIAQTSANLTQGRQGLAGCNGEGTKGYFAGGNTNTRVSTADKLTYTNDTTAAQTSANLSRNCDYLAGISEGFSKGYFAGGVDSANTAQADKINFSTDVTVSQTTANLSQARNSLAGASEEYTTVFGSACVFSGNISSSEVGLIHFSFPYPYSGFVQSGGLGDNAINSGNIASGQVGRFHINDFSVGTDGRIRTKLAAGYFAGGYTTAAQNLSPNTYKLIYTTDTTASATSANLTIATSQLAGVSEGSTKGYFAGGYTNNNTATAHKLSYSNDTTLVQTSANLSQARIPAGCSGDGTKGYFAGGDSVTTADKLAYSTNTTIAQTTANLSQARVYLSGISEGSTKGYFAGGFTGGASGQQATADKITYSNDTTAAQASANLSQARLGLGGCSGNNTKGYFAGGQTTAIVATADKIIYATDTTAAQTSANLSQARIYLAGVTEGYTKGYFAGGYTGSNVPVATADKITFATDITAAQTTANLIVVTSHLAGIDGGAIPFGNNCVFSGNISSSTLNWTNFISGTFASGGGLRNFSSGTISSGMFGDSSVVSGSIASGQIFRFHLSDQSVYSDSVRSGSVSTFKLANNAVFSGNISISDTITTINLASGGVQSGAFGDSMIASGDILSGRITTTNISSGALQKQHISSGSLSNVQFASGAAVGSFKLASGMVVSGNIASGTIFFTPFIDGAIESGNIASGVIGLFHPADSSVTSGAIPSGTVIFNMVGANATVANNFADVALASSNFTLQSVTGDNLAAGVWPQPTAFFVSGGITAYMFNNNSVVNGSFAPNTFTPAGYFAGGVSAGTTAAITQKLVYNTEIMSLLATSNLSTARQELTGCSGDGNKGYFAGGTSSTGSLNFNIVDIMFYYIDKPYFSNTAVLTQGRYGLASVTNNATKGYFVGGTTGNASCLTTAEVVTYSNDIVSSQTTANLPVGTSYLIGCSGDNTKGYFCGGETTSASNPTVTTTYKITYSTESTISQTSANLSQAREYSAGLTEGTTKGYILGGMSTNVFNTPVNTADLIVYATDSASAKTSAQLSTARGKCGAISDRSTKGFIAGGETNLLQNVNITDKLTYATDITVSQTSSNFATSVARYASVDGGNSPLTSVVVTSGKLTTTAANEITFINIASGAIVSGSMVSGVVFSDATTNNFSNAGVRSGNIQSGEIGRIHFANASIISGNIGSGVIRFPEFFGDTAQYFVIGSGQIGNIHIGENYLVTSSKLASGTISLTTASGQNASFPYNFAETAQVNTNRAMFDYFLAGELISGIKAVCIGSGNLVRRAERASGLRLPAIGCTSGAILSGTLGRVFYHGYLGSTVSGQVASGFQGQPLYVGSGGFIVNQSGFMGGASSGAPFLSGDMQQLIGVAMSGGLFVMPSPMMIRSGFQGTLPYNMR